MSTFDIRKPCRMNTARLGALAMLAAATGMILAVMF